MLGGACTYIALASSYFAQTRIVGVVGDDFAKADEQFLAGHGIDLQGLERVSGKTFYWAGVYSSDMNDRTTVRTDLNVFAGFEPKLPASYIGSPYLILGRISFGDYSYKRVLRRRSSRDARSLAGNSAKKC